MLQAEARGRWVAGESKLFAEVIGGKAKRQRCANRDTQGGSRDTEQRRALRPRAIIVGHGAPSGAKVGPGVVFPQNAVVHGQKLAALVIAAIPETARIRAQGRVTLVIQIGAGP